MYLITGKITDTRINISATYNLDFVPQDAIIIQDDEVSKTVEPYELTPPNPDPKMSYIPYYNLITSEIEYEEIPIPIPEPTDEQKRIEMLEISTLALMDTIVELQGGMLNV